MPPSTAARAPRLTRRARATALRRRRVDEPVADAPDVDDVAVAARAELAPQAAGVRVERPRRADRALAPDRAQQLGLREDARRIAGEDAQQRELLRAQVERRRRPGARCARRCRCAGSATRSRPRAAAAVGAAQDRLDAAAQLAVGERLGDARRRRRARRRGRGRARRRRRGDDTGTLRSARQATPSLSRTCVRGRGPSGPGSAASTIARSGNDVSEPAQAFAGAVGRDARRSRRR